MGPVHDLSVVAAADRMRQPSASLHLCDASFRVKWFVMGACLLFSAYLGTTLMRRPDSFSSEALVLVRNGRTEVPVGMSAPVPQDISDAQLGTELQLLQSPELHASVLASLSGVSQNDMSQVASSEKLNRFAARFKVTLVPKSDLIRLTYTDSKPGQARDTMRAIVARYLDYHLRVYDSGGSLDFFKAQASRYAKELREAQSQLTAFERTHRISVLAEQKDVTLRKLSDMQAQLDAARTEQAETDQRRLKLLRNIESAAPRIQTQHRDVPNQYLVEHLNASLVDLQNKRTELLTRYQPEDRLVKEVDRQIHDTRVSLDAAAITTNSEEASDVNPLRLTLESDLSKTQVNAAGLTARIDALTKSVREIAGELESLGGVTGDEETLQRAAKEAQENYLLYTRKSEEARINGALDRQKISNVTLAESPTLPDLPAPRFSFATVCAFLLGNLLIAASAIVYSMRRPVFRTPWDLDLLNDAPVLATIPFHSGTFLKSSSERAEQPVQLAVASRATRIRNQTALEER